MPSADQRARPRWPSRSAQLLVYAVVVTAFVVLGGSCLVWGLFRDSASAVEQPNESSLYAPAEPLTVAIGRTPGGPGEWIAYAAVFAQVEQDLEQPVEFRYALSRGDITPLAETEAYDIALISVNTYLEQSRHRGIRMVAAPVIEGQSMDAAVAVVPRGSALTRFDELRGTRVALVRGSLAGERFAHWLCAERGEDVDGFFGDVDYVDTQDVALEMLLDGKTDATFVRRSDLAPWSEDRFSVVAESPEFGMPPIVAREGLPEGEIERIRRSLLAAATREAIPPNSALSGFALVDDSHYDFSRVLRDSVPADDPGRKESD